MKTRKTGKLKAFTIMELVVAMLISSIVVSMAYAGFLLVRAQLGSLKHTTEEVNTFLLLNRAMESDLDRSATVVRHAHGMRCLRDDGTVLYHFSDTAILRQWEQAGIDTFRFERVRASFWFEGQLQDTNGQLLDALTCTLTQKNDTLRLYLSKSYDRQTLFYFENIPDYERH